MGQPIPPPTQTGSAGGHEHPHDHPHDHPDLWARINSMRTEHEAAMEQLRTDVRADRDVTAANDAAIAAETAALAAMEAAQAAAEEAGPGEEEEVVEEEETDMDEEESDESMEPPPAPVSHTPPGPKKPAGMWDKYPAPAKRT